MVGTFSAGFTVPVQGRDLLSWIYCASPRQGPSQLDLLCQSKAGTFSAGFTVSVQGRDLLSWIYCVSTRQGPSQLDLLCQHKAGTFSAGFTVSVAYKAGTFSAGFIVPVQGRDLLGWIYCVSTRQGPSQLGFLYQYESGTFSAGFTVSNVDAPHKLAKSAS